MIDAIPNYIPESNAGHAEESHGEKSPRWPLRLLLLVMITLGVALLVVVFRDGGDDDYDQIATRDGPTSTGPAPSTTTLSALPSPTDPPETSLPDTTVGNGRGTTTPSQQEPSSVSGPEATPVPATSPSKRQETVPSATSPTVTEGTSAPVASTVSPPVSGTAPLTTVATAPPLYVGNWDGVINQPNSQPSQVRLRLFLNPPDSRSRIGSFTVSMNASCSGTVELQATGSDTATVVLRKTSGDSCAQVITATLTRSGDGLRYSVLAAIEDGGTTVHPIASGVLARA